MCSLLSAGVRRQSLLGANLQSLLKSTQFSSVKPSPDSFPVFVAEYHRKPELGQQIWLK